MGKSGNMKKQIVVARSSAEIEFRAVAQGICKGIVVKETLRGAACNNEISN